MQIPWSETPAIRPLAYADIADLAEIEKEEPSVWSASAIAAELLQKDGIQLVFSKGRITSGWLCCRISGCEAELLKVTVSRKCRHRGVATLLLSYLEKELTEQGVSKLFLEVRSSNASAITFYFQAGFTEVGRRLRYYRQPIDDALLFKKKLWCRKTEEIMKGIRDLDLTNKRVLVRVDFNVPMDEQGIITDDIRMKMALPTLEYLRDQQAKLIVCSHMGRPKGKRVDAFSLAPVAAHLGSLLGCSVTLAPDCVGAEVRTMADHLNPGEVLLLENLRFHPQETENDPEFAAELAQLAEVYINDAFAVSHRAHASVSGVAERVAEKGAGFLLQKEIDYFNKAMEMPVRPLAAVIGGAKVSSKIGALENMLDRVDRMIIGGAMANTFLKAQGVDTGASLVENDLLEVARQFVKKAEEKGVRLYLPVDFVVADSFSEDAVTKHVTFRDVPESWMALDIGPATSIYFQEALAGAKTIVWNGPMGAFEMDPFARGTMALCHVIASSHALSITGGGDSNAAVKKAGESKNISYMSTGGGAFLRLMEGKSLPGVEVLK